MKDLSHYSKDFPLLQKKIDSKPLIYLDTAATAQKPRTVIDTLTRFYSEHYGTVHRAVYTLALEASHAYEMARVKVQNFLKAEKPEEIIFTRGTTESINLIASSFGKKFLKPGDEILITEMEHHSNIVPWQMVCEERKAILKVVPISDDGEILMDHFYKLLNNRTKLVALTHVSNVLGTINPVKELIALAHERGAQVLIDGAQAAPHIPIDVVDLDADFYVFSGHKTYGPTGIGVLYGKFHLLSALPPYQGGGHMIEKVTFTKTTYQEPPLRFEAGTAIIAEAIGLAAAIDYLQSVGIDKIHSWEQALHDYTTEKLREIPKLKIFGNSAEKGGVVSFHIDGIHPLDIATLLDLQGIAIRSGHLCAQPLMTRFGVSAMSRASFSFTNSKAEIDQFITSLKEVVKQLS